MDMGTDMARFIRSLQSPNPDLRHTNRHPWIWIAILTGLLGLAGWLTPGTASAQDPTADTTIEALTRVLEDPEARTRLIQALREVTSEAEPALPGNGLDVISLPRQFALLTQKFAESAVDELSEQILLVTDVARGSIDINYVAILLALLDLIILIAATVALFWVLRRMATPVFRRLDQWVQSSPEQGRWLKQVPGISLAFLLDILVVGLAWVGGYGLGLFLLGDSGTLETQYSLFLNAFLFVELLKALIRLFLASRFQGLRILPIDGEDSAYWNAWLSRMIGFLGYGLLIVVPLVKFHISLAAGNVATLLIVLTAYSKTVAVILQNRARARKKLETLGEASQLAFFRFTMNFLAHIWHWIALLYFTALAAISITRPENALPFMASATVQTILAIVVGFVVAGVLTQIISRRIQIPEETRQHFPLLEERLNAYIPTALKVMRAGIILIVIAVIADAWAVFNLGAWVSSESGSFLLSKILSVATILIFTALLWLLIASWIEHQLSTSGPGGTMAGARKKTLLAIFRNAVAVTLLIMVTMIVLAEIGINIGPLIAGAGVIGLAIGFGAQKLVQDIITGVFIQLENAMNAGDVVQVAGITGTVEKLTIRSLGLRDISGTQHVIPFSSVTTVSNLTRDFGYHVGIYGVAYRENTDTAIEHLRAAFAELLQDPQHAPNILGDLEVHGITEFGDNAVNLRVRIKTLPGMQWGIGRAYNRLVKLHFDAAGIEIPFPHRTIYFGVDKDGSAPPMHIRRDHLQKD
jgi:small-conductance mechanosensitive channel